MTHITIIGDNSKNKIEFKKALNDLTHQIDDIIECEKKPSDFKFIELICRNYSKEYDLMFAHDGDRSNTGCLYLGYFNDGVV